MEQLEEVIAAFVDDERVDGESLKRALALPEGRDYLVELLAMRELVALPMEAALTTPAPRTSAWRRWGLAAAAAVVLTASTAGGYFAGTRVATTATGSQPSVPPVAPVALPDTASVAPPAPTTVIKLQSGVDWTERSGGGN